jgi:hypothetical protein
MSAARPNNIEAQEPQLRLRPRDIALLLALLLHRVFSRQQLQALFFGSLSRANYRLSQLRRHGLIQNVEVPFSALGAMQVFAATRKAAHLVPLPPGVELPTGAPTSVITLSHTLKIGDVAVAFQLADRRGELELIEWRPEATCFHEYAVLSNGVASQRRIVRPDGFVRLEVGGASLSSFIEADLATVSLVRIERKLKGYQFYRTCGAYNEVYGPGDFSVMFVCPNQRRLNQLLGVARIVPALHVYGTTFVELEQVGPTGGIWRQADQVCTLNELVQALRPKEEATTPGAAAL